MSPFVRQNAPLLRFLARQPEGGATIAAIAEHFGRDRENTRKTIKKLGTEDVVGWSSTSAALTDAGRAALAELDVLEGGPPPPTAESIARVPVDKLERSPLNAREDMGDLDGLAAVFIHEGDCPQPLEIGPLNDDGKHYIHAGERRWRAGMLALEQGLTGIVADQGLPCIVKTRTRAEILYTVVVENSQRKNLTALEDARGLLALQEETGLSARALAFATGRAKEGSETGVADVQQKIKIAKKATPEAIAAYLADGNWDRLRDSVAEKAPAPSGPYVFIGVDFGNATRFEEAKRLAEGTRAGAGSPPPLAITNPRLLDAGAPAEVDSELPMTTAAEAAEPEAALLALTDERLLVEIAHKTAHRPMDQVSGLAKAGEYWRDLRATRLQTLRLVAFRHAGIPMVGVTQAGCAWLLANGYSLPIDDAQLAAAYDRSGHDGWPFADSGYATVWLNTDPGQAAPAPQEADQQADIEDAVDDAQLADDRETLAMVEALVEGRRTKRHGWGVQIPEILCRLGLSMPPNVSTAPEDAGCLNDANGEPICVVDVNRENSDPRANAIALLIGIALEAFTSLSLKMAAIRAENAEPEAGGEGEMPPYLARLAGAQPAEGAAS
jgi:hypothetical protein